MAGHGAAFDAEAAEFETSLAEPWNRLKYDLALANLLDHLPAPAEGGGRETEGGTGVTTDAAQPAPSRSSLPPPASLAVLDAGGGTGELGLRLVGRGGRLTLLDPSGAMLAIAREKAAGLGVARRCRFVQGPVEALPSTVADEGYDVVLCHNVLEYVADAAATVRALAGVLRPGGVLSLLVMNSDALPLRELLLRGDPEAALAAFGRREFVNRFGIVARTFPPAEARAGDRGRPRRAGLVRRAPVLRLHQRSARDGTRLLRRDQAPRTGGAGHRPLPPDRPRRADHRRRGLKGEG